MVESVEIDAECNDCWSFCYHWLIEVGRGELLLYLLVKCYDYRISLHAACIGGSTSCREYSIEGLFADRGVRVATNGFMVDELL